MFHLPELQPIEPITVTSWDYPQWRQNAFYIEDIARGALGLQETVPVRFVPQGRLARVAIDAAEPDIIASDGFSVCSALIIKDVRHHQNIFAHLQPLDHDLYEQIRTLDVSDSEVALVQGSDSSGQMRALEALGNMVSKVHHITVETGPYHWATFLHVSTGRIGMVSKIEGHPLSYFEPFHD